MPKGKGRAIAPFSRPVTATNSGPDDGTVAMGETMEDILDGALCLLLGLCPVLMIIACVVL